MLCWVLVAGLTTACQAGKRAQSQVSLSSGSLFVSNVPLLTAAHLQPDFWLGKVDNANQVLLSQTDIQRFNDSIIKNLDEVVDVFAEPEVYSAAELQKLIKQLSHPAAHPRFTADGTELTAKHWSDYDRLLGITQLPSEVNAEFALVTSRGSLRTYPTDQPIFSSATDQHLDRFQETAVFPGEALQVLHYSQDRQWAFVRHYHYNGWLSVQHFATSTKSTVQKFVTATDFLLVTGDRVYTNVSAEMIEVSAIMLEMGVKLPLIRQPAAVVNGQNSSFSYVVALPIRQTDGQLRIAQGLIGRNQDVSIGYLPLTKTNIVHQAFKFLGEPYGWGHALHARDCSGFIGEVFRSFGFILPRNTGSQGLASFGGVLSLADSSGTKKQQALTHAQLGDLIFIPGHVMLVLGREKGETFVIHDVAGLHYYVDEGRLYHSMLNGVSVTPLSPLQRNEQQSYIDGIYMLKSLSREHYVYPAN